MQQAQQQQAPIAEPVAQPAPQAPPQQMANGGGNFEAQETMQGDGVAQTPETTPAPTTDAPIMEEGGEVSSDGLDWGLVFTFFNFTDVK